LEAGCSRVALRLAHTARSNGGDIDDVGLYKGQGGGGEAEAAWSKSQEEKRPEVKVGSVMVEVAELRSILSTL
jgi:hypothetical protein